MQPYETGIDDFLLYNLQSAHKFRTASKRVYMHNARIIMALLCGVTRLIQRRMRSQPTQRIGTRGGEKRIFLCSWMENCSRTGDHRRVPLASYLEMMLGALIKWRLPFSAKGAAGKKCRRFPFSLVHGERWKAFRASLRSRYRARRSPPLFVVHPI